MIGSLPFEIIPSTDICELPQRGRDFHRLMRRRGVIVTPAFRTYYTYGIGFHTGIVKVGYSQWPCGRLRTLRWEGLRHGFGTATAFWLSPAHTSQEMTVRAEADLLAAMRAEAREILPSFPEWFEGTTLERSAVLADATDWGEVLVA